MSSVLDIWNWCASKTYMKWAHTSVAYIIVGLRGKEQNQKFCIKDIMSVLCNVWFIYIYYATIEKVERSTCGKFHRCSREIPTWQSEIWVDICQHPWTWTNKSLAKCSHIDQSNTSENKNIKIYQIKDWPFTSSTFTHISIPLFSLFRCYLSSRNLQQTRQRKSQASWWWQCWRLTVNTRTNKYVTFFPMFISTMKKKKAEERNRVKSGILKRMFREKFFFEGKSWKTQGKTIQARRISKFRPWGKQLSLLKEVNVVLSRAEWGKEKWWGTSWKICQGWRQWRSWVGIESNTGFILV